MSALSPSAPTYLTQEIRAALQEPEPVLANLKITRCHYLLAQELEQVLGPEAGANFHSWAVWGSRKAGVTIRQEDLDQARRDGTVVGGIVGSLVGLGCGWLLNFPLVWQPAAALLGAVCGAAVGRFIIRRSRRVSARLILAGNRTVLEDIGLQSARFIELLQRDAPAGPTEIEAFLQTLQPAPGSTHNLLQQAFSHYYQAHQTPDTARKQEATYLGNCFAVWHEHVRLEPYIQGAIPLIIRRCVTQRLLQFTIGDTHLAVAHDVPSQVHLPLTAATPALVLLATVGGSSVAPGPASAGTAAHDWTRIQQRMRYVFALFRAFHTDVQVRTAPYSAPQLAAINAGHYPTGAL
ncbi:cytidylyltransferase family protein [Hymenobacter perfusus]|uniref:Uncharacterized protein n=1 Tax=Hymenobacter perfusus TaxID=1236770 RepID=A0A3R9NWS4_9BACT|nr:hypothetical protein [Hymenobacter perfusus]RSK43536.1 hypothetical protein EI293_11645 [Hymenobacter perfusus]